jgi:hypothetical protein
MLSGCPGVVLIAWEHAFIPLIAHLIVGNTATVPQSWPSERFDVGWVFDLDPAANAVPSPLRGKLIRHACEGFVPSKRRERKPGKCHFMS